MTRFAHRPYPLRFARNSDAAFRTASYGAAIERPAPSLHPADAIAVYGCVVAVLALLGFVLAGWV